MHIAVSESIRQFWTIVANNILPIIIIGSIFVEITPIKFNPISWLADLFRKPIKDDLDITVKKLSDEMDAKNKALEDKLDSNNEKIQNQIQEIKDKQNAICETINTNDEKNDKRYMLSLRLEILEFANSIENGTLHSREEYNHVKTVIREYQDIIKSRNMTNGAIDEAVEKIREHYEENKETTSFYF